MLLVTDSDSTVSGLLETEIGGDALAWSDRLHIGRVTPTTDFVQFIEDRASVYGELSWDEDGVAAKDFALRNEVFFEALQEGEEIRLLFGRSLGDQLKLAQICFWLSVSDSVCLDRVFLKVAENRIQYFEDAGYERLNVRELADYRNFWMSYVGRDPRFLLSALTVENEAIARASKRLLMEYPSFENGLSLSEAQVLDAVALGMSHPKELFDAFQETEEYPYLLDWDFWALLDRLCSGKNPLLECSSGDAFMCPPKTLAWEAFHAQSLRLTIDGEAVLRGDSHLAALNFPSRWIGGCFLEKGSMWYWDYASETLTRTAPTREFAN